jgi:hypothetical protein
MRKTGIILFLLGVALGALAMVFATGYQAAQGFLGSLPAMEVQVRPGTTVTLADEPVTDRKAMFEWVDAQGHAQRSDRAPAPTTEVSHFRVLARTGSAWTERPGRVRTELRGRKAVPLRSVLAGAVILAILGLGMALLARVRYLPVPGGLRPHSRGGCTPFNHPGVPQGRPPGGSG